MSEILESEKVEEVKKIINNVDALLKNEQYNIVDVLNALSMFSVAIAVRLAVDKNTYLNDLSIMYDERKTINESTF